jgi:hypothetical protein
MDEGNEYLNNFIKNSENNSIGEKNHPIENYKRHSDEINKKLNYQEEQK